MKKTVFAGPRFALALLLVSFISGVATAQKTVSPSPKPEKNDVNVRIIERNGDEVREIERTYHMDGMNDLERDKLVMKLVDSLKTTRKGAGQRQMTIIVEDNYGDRTVTRERISPGKRRVPADAYVQRGKLQRNNPDFWNNQTWQQEFRWHADSMADQLRRFKFQMPKDFDRQIARPFEDWARNFNSKPSTIRGLDAYPNNPDRDQLNVRFTAPSKGDVSIIVTNTKGKEIAKREIKDFSGEFVGQIDLGKKSQGTYFVTVTQNEDGAVKRIVVE
ncbi:T9SS type A sorting domain-containing protein [Spirosoma validum]|uniref:T9SS type A sorting domain-containing protein n=1 Tax=Spirosoma validum TaxID=2771355 RepID=A0A927GEI6_9BACT|nr:T9SS type A sorting domain-containing protein [Spirosoma validum]MBD2754718.1 T9SS type A sorting domain-containing protein [Spirosoma validum]